MVRVSLLVGWFVGTGLTFYGLPHALIHDEWEDHGWRVDAARRALKLGPFLYFGPIIVAPIVGGVAHRRSWDTEGFLQRASAYELAWYSEIHRGQGESMRLEGRYLIVWKRGRDDLWRMHRNMYNFSAATPVN